MATRGGQSEDVKLQEQIQRIFGCVVLHEKLSQKALQKARQLMMLNLKQIASEALNRSICRDGTSTLLQARDLLAAIETRGDIYKFKIVRTFLMNKTRSQLNEKPDKDVKAIKQAEFDDKGIDDDD